MMRHVQRREKKAQQQQEGVHADGEVPEDGVGQAEDEEVHEVEDADEVSRCLDEKSGANGRPRVVGKGKVENGKWKAESGQAGLRTDDKKSQEGATEHMYTPRYQPRGCLAVVFFPSHYALRSVYRGFGQGRRKGERVAVQGDHNGGDGRHRLIILFIG